MLNELDGEDRIVAIIFVWKGIDEVEMIALDTWVSKLLGQKVSCCKYLTRRTPEFIDMFPQFLGHVTTPGADLQHPSSQNLTFGNQ